MRKRIWKGKLEITKNNELWKNLIQDLLSEFENRAKIEYRDDESLIQNYKTILELILSYFIEKNIFKIKDQETSLHLLSTLFSNFLFIFSVIKKHKTSNTNINDVLISITTFFITESILKLFIKDEKTKQKFMESIHFEEFLKKQIPRIIIENEDKARIKSEPIPEEEIKVKQTLSVIKQVLKQNRTQILEELQKYKDPEEIYEYLIMLEQIIVNNISITEEINTTSTTINQILTDLFTRTPTKNPQRMYAIEHTERLQLIISEIFILILSIAKIDKKVVTQEELNNFISKFLPIINCIKEIKIEDIIEAKKTFNADEYQQTDTIAKTIFGYDFKTYQEKFLTTQNMAKETQEAVATQIPSEINTEEVPAQDEAHTPNENKSNSEIEILDKKNKVSDKIKVYNKEISEILNKINEIEALYKELVNDQSLIELPKTEEGLSSIQEQIEETKDQIKISKENLKDIINEFLRSNSTEAIDIQNHEITQNITTLISKKIILEEQYKKLKLLLELKENKSELEKKLKDLEKKEQELNTLNDDLDKVLLTIRSLFEKFETTVTNKTNG